MFGKEHTLVATLARAGLRHAARSARQQHHGDDPRARHPGRGRRDLPARVRDHPGRVPARPGRAGDRPDLGDPRDRRWTRDRARRADHRRPLVPLAVLDPARVRRDRDDRHGPVRPRVADQVTRADQLGRRDPALRLAHVPARRDQRGTRLGLGKPADRRPVRRRRRAACRLDRERAAGGRAARRHGDDADPRRVDRQRRSVPRRRRDVQLVHPHPAVRRDAAVGRIWLRRRRHPGRTVPRPLHR